MAERRGDPKPVDEVVARLLRALGLDRFSREQEVFTRWEEALGLPLASHMKPVAVHNGSLVVAVRDSAWMQELQFMREEIKKKLNKTLGKGVISSIRFKAGSWDDAPTVGAVEEKRPEVTLPAEVEAEARAAVGCIADPALREQALNVLLASARINSREDGEEDQA